MLFTITYILGYLWFWRYIAGALMEEATCGDPEPFDYIMCCLCTTLATLFWPVIVPFRVFYILIKKYGVGNGMHAFLFPRLKEIETRDEKQARIERESREELFMRQRHINAKERELGIELTEWENATR